MSAPSLTAEQIAKKVGLSNATVSRVLNNSQSVRPETREVVLAAVRENGRMPRLMGRRIKQTKAKPVVQAPGLFQILMFSRFPIDQIKEGDAGRGTEFDRLKPDEFFSAPARLATSFSRHIIDGIIDELQRFQMRAIVRVVSSLSARELVNEINASENRGLFLFGIHDKEVDKFIPKLRCPIVTLMTWEHEGWPDYVGIDNFAGIRASFNHLHGLGHSRIGYVAGQLEFSLVFRERLAAYKTRLADAGLAYRPEWIVEGSCKLDAMEADVYRVLSSPDRPTAMMCCFDGAAVSVKRAADRLGLQIPQDLSVVGFDDEDIAQLFSPALTTVRVPTVQMGRNAVHLMMMRQQQARTVTPNEGCSIRITPSLVVRQSTARPPVL